MLAPRPTKLRSQRDINLWRIPLQSLPWRWERLTLGKQTVPVVPNRMPPFSKTLPAFALRLPSFVELLPVSRKSLPRFASLLPVFRKSIPQFRQTLPHFRKTVTAFAKTLTVFWQSCTRFTKSLPLRSREGSRSSKTVHVWRQRFPFFAKTLPEFHAGPAAGLNPVGSAAFLCTLNILCFGLITPTTPRPTIIAATTVSSRSSPT
jgi:hypothetical protein